MPSGYYNLNIYQGDTFDLTIVARNSDGSAMNLSGYSGFGGIKTSYCSTNYLETFNITFSQSTTGQLGISLTAAETASLPTTIGLYDLEVASGSYVNKLLKGDVIIHPQISSSFP